MSYITAEMLKKRPGDMCLIADVVADKAQNRRLSRRRAYAVARTLTAEQLLECYHAEDFLEVFTPHYEGTA